MLLQTTPTHLHLPTALSAAGHRPDAPGVATELLDALAERFRPAGLMLAIFRPDGSLVYADAAAQPFFQKYVLQAIRLLPVPSASAAAATPTSPVQTTPEAISAALGWRQIPGVVISGFAHSDRRFPTTLVVIAAKCDRFELGEDQLRACSRLGLDAQWLAAAADDLPGYSPAALGRQTGLLQAALNDLLEVAGSNRELASLSQQLSDTYEELSLIYQLSSGMKVNRLPGDFFKQACLDVMQVMDVRGMGVALSVDIRGCPPPALYGRMNLSANMVRRLSDELLAALRIRKSPLLIDRLPQDRSFGWLSDHARQLLAVPLMRQDQVLGCLFALDKEDGDFDSVDSKLLASIGNESAIYLENAALFDDVHGLMMGLLHSLTSAVDAKDTYTCGHSERVALLSRHLAQQARLRDADVEQVYMAGLLHDVGKIGVPESVLQKAGRLTPEEFEHMKKHPEIGARILADVKQLKSILPGVMHHHERWDGRGYPHALAGEKIPMMGRIICLADCFDAMTSNRTYRRALPVEVAMCEIRRCSGTQFDPFLAEAFVRSDAESLRELLRDHKIRSKQLIEMQETMRSGAA